MFLGSQRDLLFMMSVPFISRDLSLVVWQVRRVDDGMDGKCIVMWRLGRDAREDRLFVMFGDILRERGRLLWLAILR
jgi:hypothetical protein